MGEFQISSAALLANTSQFSELQDALMQGFEVWTRAAVAGAASWIAQTSHADGGGTAALQQQYWDDVVEPAAVMMMATILQVGEWPTVLTTIAAEYAAADRSSAEALAAVDANARDELR